MPPDYHKRATDKKRAARLRWETAEGLSSYDYVSSKDELAKAGEKLRVKNGAVVRPGSNKTKSAKKHKTQCPECKCSLQMGRLERHLLRVHQYPAKQTEKLVANFTSAPPQQRVESIKKVNCPKCRISVSQSSLMKHLEKVHKEVPGIIPRPFVQKKAAEPVSTTKCVELNRVLKPVVPLSPNPPGPQETLPTIVRCAICRQHVKYFNLIAHYALLHAQELPAYTDETCHS